MSTTKTPNPGPRQGLRPVVVVPAYNEGAKVAGVVTRLLPLAAEVVVVDDGSADGTAEAACGAGATVLRHLVNRGQGAALQTGIAWAVRRGAEAVVTFDADGQHRAEDVAALLAPLERGEAQVALGSRQLGSSEGIPRVRRAMLRLAVLFSRLTSGLAVTDAHNGLRAFTPTAARGLDLRMDRMAHASEILDRIGRAGWSYTEVPVHVRYTDYSRAKGQRTTAALRILVDYLLGRWVD